ncbi:MAG: hypothetical protein R3F30_15675 [Planctomycetota bacterium]
MTASTPDILPSSRSVPAALRRLTLAACCFASVAASSRAQDTGQEGQAKGEAAQPTQERPFHQGQDGEWRGPRPQVPREQMWPAPTAEDWKKPCLIRWQRTWTDALAVAKETGKPILVCVNMDGEIASEHYAGIRYRQPDKARLYEPYVTVIASVYRHTPRDYDDHGHRIPCPRFGTVTCGEHIAIEPILYEKFMDGRRISPRHIMVELDGKERYDVYYTWDVASVFDTIKDGIERRDVHPEPYVRGDRTILERVASRDSLDREAVEKAYAEGDAEVRRSLLEAAGQHVDAAPLGLLRQAIHGFDTELANEARDVLARATTADAVPLLNEALAVPLDEKQKAPLVAALERIGETSLEARRLAVVHRGLEGEASGLDANAYGRKLAAGAEYPAPKDHEVLVTEIEAVDAKVRERPTDPAVLTELAASSLALAFERQDERARRVAVRSIADPARLLFLDARDAALEAEKRGATGWPLDGVLAVAELELGDKDAALARAEKCFTKIPAGDTGRCSKVVLELVARARMDAIVEAVQGRKRWPSRWLADLHSAYAILARHPLGEARHVVEHHDTLDWLGVSDQAMKVLEQGIARFPDSALLHDRLRKRILAKQGVDGLEPWYAERLKADDAVPQMWWFAGYTSIVVGEYERRAGKLEEAREAYGRAIQRFETYAKKVPAHAAGADDHVAMALAGRARAAFELADYDAAVRGLLASFERKPEAAATLDGLNVSAVDTAKMLLSFLQEEDSSKELAAKLRKGLEALDPKLLELPPYEREPGSGGQRR